MNIMNIKVFSSVSAAAIATALVSFSAPAHAAFSFGTNGISFTSDTKVNFTFNKSQGAAKSTFGIYDGNKNLIQTLFQEKERSDAGNNGANSQWLGTAANLTGASTASFTFLANQVYSLGLVSQGWVSSWTLFSTSSLNTNSFGSQQAVFGSGGGQEAQALAGASSLQSSSPFAKGGTLISFEDIKGGGDRDFNDFTVNAEAVPEPFTMSGLAMGFGGLALARRRRNQKAV